MRNQKLKLNKQREVTMCSVAHVNIKQNVIVQNITHCGASESSLLMVVQHMNDHFVP